MCVCVCVCVPQELDTKNELLSAQLNTANTELTKVSTRLRVAEGKAAYVGGLPCFPPGVAVRLTTHTTMPTPSRAAELARSKLASLQEDHDKALTQIATLKAKAARKSTSHTSHPPRSRRRSSGGGAGMAAAAAAAVTAHQATRGRNVASRGRGRRRRRHSISSTGVEGAIATAEAAAAVAAAADKSMRRRLEAARREVAMMAAAHADAVQRAEAAEGRLAQLTDSESAAHDGESSSPASPQKVSVAPSLPPGMVMVPRGQVDELLALQERCRELQARSDDHMVQLSAARHEVEVSHSLAEAAQAKADAAKSDAATARDALNDARTALTEQQLRVVQLESDAATAQSNLDEAAAAAAAASRREAALRARIVAAERDTESMRKELEQYLLNVAASAAANAEASMGTGSDGGLAAAEAAELAKLRLRVTVLHGEVETERRARTAAEVKAASALAARDHSERVGVVASKRAAAAEERGREAAMAAASATARASEVERQLLEVQSALTDVRSESRATVEALTAELEAARQRCTMLETQAATAAKALNDAKRATQDAELATIEARRGTAMVRTASGVPPGSSEASTQTSTAATDAVDHGAREKIAALTQAVEAATAALAAAEDARGTAEEQLLVATTKLDAVTRRATAADEELEQLRVSSTAQVKAAQDAAARAQRSADEAAAKAGADRDAEVGALRARLAGTTAQLEQLQATARRLQDAEAARLAEAQAKSQAAAALAAAQAAQADSDGTSGGDVDPLAPPAEDSGSSSSAGSDAGDAGDGASATSTPATTPSANAREASALAARDVAQAEAYTLRDALATAQAEAAAHAELSTQHESRAEEAARAARAAQQEASALRQRVAELEADVARVRDEAAAAVERARRRADKAVAQAEAEAETVVRSVVAQRPRSHRSSVASIVSMLSDALAPGRHTRSDEDVAGVTHPVVPAPAEGSDTSPTPDDSEARARSRADQAGEGGGGRQTDKRSGGAHGIVDGDHDRDGGEASPAVPTSSHGRTHSDQQGGDYGATSFAPSMDGPMPLGSLDLAFIHSRGRPQAGSARPAPHPSADARLPTLSMQSMGWTLDSVSRFALLVESVAPAPATQPPHGLSSPPGHREPRSLPWVFSFINEVYDRLAEAVAAADKAAAVRAESILTARRQSPRQKHAQATRQSEAMWRTSRAKHRQHPATAPAPPPAASIDVPWVTEATQPKRTARPAWEQTREVPPPRLSAACADPAAAFAAAAASGGPDAIPKALQLPEFVLEHVMSQVGLRGLAYNKLQDVIVSVTHWRGEHAWVAMFAAFLEEAWPAYELHLVLRCCACVRAATAGARLSRQVVSVSSPTKPGSRVSAVHATAHDKRHPVARPGTGRVSALGSVTEEEYVSLGRVEATLATLYARGWWLASLDPPRVPTTTAGRYAAVHRDVEAPDMLLKESVGRLRARIGTRAVAMPELTAAAAASAAASTTAAATAGAASQAARVHRTEPRNPAARTSSARGGGGGGGGGRGHTAGGMSPRSPLRTAKPAAPSVPASAVGAAGVSDATFAAMLNKAASDARSGSAPTQPRRSRSAMGSRRPGPRGRRSVPSRDHKQRRPGPGSTSVAVLQGAVQHGRPAARPEFTAVDGEGDDRWLSLVSLLEVLLAELRQSRMVRHVWQWASEMFTYVDDDHDGFITCDEFVRVFTEVWPRHSPRELRMVFARLVHPTGLHNMSAPAFRTAVSQLLLPFVTVYHGGRTHGVAAAGPRGHPPSTSAVGSLVLPPLPHAVDAPAGEHARGDADGSLAALFRSVASHWQGMRPELARYVAMLGRSARSSDVRVADHLEQLQTALQEMLASGAPASDTAAPALYCYRLMLVTVAAHQVEWQRFVGTLAPVDVSSELQALEDVVLDRWHAVRAASQGVPSAGMLQVPFHSRSSLGGYGGSSDADADADAGVDAVRRALSRSGTAQELLANGIHGEVPAAGRTRATHSHDGRRQPKSRPPRHGTSDGRPSGRGVGGMGGFVPSTMTSAGMDTTQSGGDLEARVSVGHGVAEPWSYASSIGGDRYVSNAGPNGPKPVFSAHSVGAGVS